MRKSMYNLKILAYIGIAGQAGTSDLAKRYYSASAKAKNFIQKHGINYMGKQWAGINPGIIACVIIIPVENWIS
jgi:hypothetical protein